MGILHTDNKNKIHENAGAENYNCGVMVMVVSEWLLCMQDSGSKELCLTQCVYKSKKDMDIGDPWSIIWYWYKRVLKSLSKYMIFVQIELSKYAR